MNPEIVLQAQQVNLPEGVCRTEQRMWEEREAPILEIREHKINKAIRLTQVRSSYLPPVNYTLPVVFHIISNNPAAIGDAQMIAAIQDLNDAFAHTGPYVSGPGADTHISFCLAHVDPSGGNTTGITRTTSYLADLSSDMEDDRLKNLVDWDPTRYINIWFVASLQKEVLPIFICGEWSRMNEGGYATLPPSAGSILDGIVVTASGIALAHEMGHYLGLYHTFEGMDCKNDDCTTDGDQVCDTPPQKDATSSPSCSSPKNSCSTDTLSGFATDVPDLISNFMSYGNSACVNEFTAGQGARMQATIATVRSSLLQPECLPSCAENSLASFTRNEPYPIPGDLVNFTNTSTGATNFEWSVDNVVLSNSANFSTSFPATGKYTVRLKAYNLDASCYASYSDDVLVSCGVVARYYTDKQTIASKESIYADSIQFTNRSVNANSYKWLLSDTAGMTDSLVSIATDLSYVFDKPGEYTMRLVASNGPCTDTSEPYSVLVHDPTADGILTVGNIHCYHSDSLQMSLIVCNNGYAPIPQGIPISFYDADPAVGQAHKLGASFMLPVSVPGMCCSDTIIAMIDAGKTGFSQLYALFNDQGNTLPPVLPNTSFPEIDYSNNKTIAGFIPFQVLIQPADSTVLRKIPFPLNAIVSGGIADQISWDPSSDLSCSDCLTPILNPPYTRQYRVVVKNQYSCVTSAFALIKTFSGGSVNIPSAFTPNGDGQNDVFYVLGGEDVKAVHNMIIYTRYGSKLFEISNVPPNDPTFGWNGSFRGKIVSAGTYVYVVQISLTSGKEESFKGTLELIR